VNVNTRAMGSTYLSWAKLHSHAKYNLATSGIMSYPLLALPFSPSDLEINGATIYGYQPLQERLARKCGVGPEYVMATNGTSMANHLAMAAILEPGDDVLIERPTYGLLLEVASYLGANILRFDRRMENDFQIDVDDLRKRVTPKTRLIVITNLHNPSGALTDESTLREIGEIAAGVGARVLVDEVYLDMVASSTQTAIHLGNEFVVTNSLTKTYGLSGLRCGWILAEPKLTERIWRLNDLFNATPVHPGELLNVIALDHLEQVRERTSQLLATNWSTLDSFLGRASGLDFVRPPGGTVIFPRLKEGDVNEFCALLRSEYETSVVPGHFFEMPNHFRIGIGGDPEMTAMGLERLGKALDAYSFI
jgi:aspartate/methionine/tyrosine aminotransferase